MGKKRKFAHPSLFLMYYVCKPPTMLLPTHDIAEARMAQ